MLTLSNICPHYLFHKLKKYLYGNLNRFPVCRKLLEDAQYFFGHQLASYFYKQPISVMCLMGAPWRR